MHEYENNLDTNNYENMIFDFHNYTMMSDQYSNYFNSGQPFIVDKGDLKYTKGNVNECINYCNMNYDCIGFLIDSPHPDYDGKYNCFLKNDFKINSNYNSNSIIYFKPFMYDNKHLDNKYTINETKSFSSINGALNDCNKSSNCIGFISDNDKNLYKSIYSNTYDSNFYFIKRKID